MAQVLVMGAGVGGLSAAIVLARDGHEVTVVERDPAPPPADPHQAWAGWERPGVNQFRLAHFLLARWREEAEREMPDAIAALEERGALRANPIDLLPAGLTGGRRDGDDVFEVVTARRPIIESALAATAEATRGVTVRRGVAVAGLLADEAPGVPHVVGVRTAGGDDVRADLVVDMTGRRSPLPSWLAALGARAPAEQREDSGFVYYGRHYRAGELPEMRAGNLTHYPSVSVLTLPADNRTWSVVFCCSARDAELRGLRHPDRFEAALDHYPMVAHWKDGEPLAGVEVMAKIEDRHRRLSVDGEPVVTGVVAAGDAWACTNPSLGRGVSMGLLHVCALRDLLREVAPTARRDFAERWDEVTESTVGRVYRTTVALDRHRLAEIDAEIAGRAYESDDLSWIGNKAMYSTIGVDPDVLRAYLRIAGLLATPEQVVGDAAIRDRMFAAAAGRPRYPLPGADRATLVATATATATA
jgi:2-polyprenyl-6-methoxyphenol hydroxylase-like FAD-dependent oxidoreductase